MTLFHVQSCFLSNSTRSLSLRTLMVSCLQQAVAYTLHTSSSLLSPTVSSMEIIMHITAVAKTLWHQKHSWNESLKACEGLSSCSCGEVGQQAGSERCNTGKDARAELHAAWVFNSKQGGLNPPGPLPGSAVFLDPLLGPIYTHVSAGVQVGI